MNKYYPQNGHISKEFVSTHSNDITIILTIYCEEILYR